MDLTTVLNNFKNQRILVIGDLVLDCFIWGKVSRISPEAPVPVVDVHEKTYALGGAANVASNITALSGSATVIGAIGEDPSADRMWQLLADLGIHCVAVRDKRPTTVKTRVIAHNQQVVRFDHEVRDKLSGKALKSLLAEIREQVKSHDAVIVSDYKKGVITAEVIKVILAAAGKKFVALDPKVGHFHLYKGVSVITPNLMEAAAGAAVEIGGEDTLLRAARKLIQKLALPSLLITRGEDGMTLFEGDRMSTVKSLAKHVYDVTGAGDTVIAALTIARAAGASLEDAAVIATHAAGIVVGEVGTAQAPLKKVRESLKKNHLDIERMRF